MNESNNTNNTATNGAKTELKVHAGAGKNYLEGWINCDISGHYDMYWDLLDEETPFSDNSVSCIFTEHVLEHFHLKQATKIVKNLHDMLMPGGVIRIVVPSLASLIDGYLNDPEFLETNNKMFPNNRLAFRAQLVNKAFYGWGHKNMYDQQLMVFVLKAAGFKCKNTTFFEDGTVGNTVFKELGRRVYKVNSSVNNLNVEAVKEA